MKWIDLGLPSGTLWAEQNKKGYYTFDEVVEKFGDNIPTMDDFDELIGNCWKRWDNKRKGMELMGDNGAKLFLPAYGYRNISDRYVLCEDGCYYSAIQSDKDVLICFYLNYYETHVGYVGRNSSISVRLIKRGGEE